MIFRTPVELPPQQIQLTPQSHTFFIGSCFADHIGQLMTNCLPNKQVIVNPHGPLYNPISIRQVLASYLPSGIVKPFDEAVFFKTPEGEWRHWDYSTKFTAPTQEALKQMLRKDWLDVQKHFVTTQTLFITFSTDHVYRLTQGECIGHYVANCHKQPSRMFAECTEPLEQLTTLWTNFMQLLHNELPQMQVVFTLSPYRYAKYGMHANALSKARLMLLIDSLCQQFSFTHYFPAYEIVTDELRDYRFYDTDMLHPSDQAVNYIWERFTEWAFTDSLTNYAHERTALLRAMQHRPLNAQSDAHKAFLNKLEQKKKDFLRKWGNWE